MIPNWNKILKEWSYRVGVIKPSNNTHLYHLNKILEERGWPNEIINQFIQNLNEIAPTDMVSNPNPKGRADKVQYQYAKQWMDDNPDAETSDDFKKDVGKEKDTKKKKKTSKTSKEIKQNRQNIFDNTVTGKGGGTTALQEEIAGISREIANQHPDDTSEQHQERVSKFIKDNYGDTKFGSNEKMISGLIKKSASGLQTMKKIKSNKDTKFKDKQPPGYPINVTFTDGGTQSVRDSLEENLAKAKESGDTDAIEHYERELKYFKKHATSETGVEGDGDTAMIYEDTDGNIRVVYVSNKQTLGDPHSNATVKSASDAIKASRVKGANEAALIDRLDDSVEEALDANKDYVKNNRKSIDDNKKELNEAPLTTISTKLLTGRAEFTDKTSRKYIDKCKKNKKVLEHIEENGLDVNNDEHLVQAALAVAGKPPTDELNDSVKQAPNKLLHKITNATASVRVKMQRHIDKGMSVEEAAKKVASSKQKGKLLMGGNLTPEDCLSIYNNKALPKLEQHSKKRKQSMQDAHTNMYNSMTELDVAHYMESGMSEEDAIKKYEEEGGPNEQTYTNSFLKRMHWDRYVDGIDDDKKMIEVGDKSLSPKDFRDCLSDLTEWDGNGSLKEHLSKTMRIKPGTQELMFVGKDNKELHLGTDTWRTAGDLSKIAGGLGSDLKKCLGKK